MRMKNWREIAIFFFLAALACIAWDYMPLNTEGPHLILQSGAN